MAAKVVYRGYVCSGYQKYSGDPRRGNPDYVPEVVTERLFGDFVSEYELRNSYARWLSSWTKQNPGEDLPTLKIVEVFIDRNNIDVYYDNS